MSCFGQNEKRLLPTVALELPTFFQKDQNGWTFFAKWVEIFVKKYRIYLKNIISSEQRTKSSKHRTFLRIKRSSNFPFDGLFRTFEMRFSQNFRLLKPKHHARFAEYHFNRTKYQIRWNNTNTLNYTHLNVINKLHQNLHNKTDNNKKSLSVLWGGRWDSNPRISEPQSEVLTAWRYSPHNIL